MAASTRDGRTVTVDREHARATAEAYVRLARLAAALVEHAERDGDHMRVPVHLLQRVEREMRGRPQPSGFFTISVD